MPCVFDEARPGSCSRSAMHAVMSTSLKVVRIAAVVLRLDQPLARRVLRSGDIGTTSLARRPSREPAARPAPRRLGARRRGGLGDAARGTRARRAPASVRVARPASTIAAAAAAALDLVGGERRCSASGRARRRRGAARPAGAAGRRRGVAAAGAAPALAAVRRRPCRPAPADRSRRSPRRPSTVSPALRSALARARRRPATGPPASPCRSRPRPAARRPRPRRRPASTCATSVASRIDSPSAGTTQRQRHLARLLSPNAFGHQIAACSMRVRASCEPVAGLAVSGRLTHDQLERSARSSSCSSRFM